MFKTSGAYPRIRCLLSALALSTVAGCGDSNPQVQPDATQSADAAIPLTSVADLLAGVAARTTWADLSPSIKAGLQANADKDLAEFRAQWGAGGLATKEGTLLASPDDATLTNFDAYVAAAFASEIDPATFHAHTDIANANLLRSFKKLYLDYFATRRVAVFYLAALKDWNGTDLKQVALPDAQAIADQKAYAKAAMTELLAIPAASLNAVELALRTKATFYFRQLATGSSGFAYGGDDLLTSYGIASWATDLPYRYSADGGQIFADGAELMQVSNAFFFGTLERINVGTVHGLDYVLSSSLDPDAITGQIGDPATDPSAKGYLLLGTWYGERVASHPDATKSCTIYSAADRDDIWNSFTADSLADNERATSFETFNAGYATAKAAVLVKNRALTVTAITNVFPASSHVLIKAKRDQVIAAVNAETRAGATLDTAFAKMDELVGTTAASDFFRAKLDALVTVGGYADPAAAVTAADIATVNTMWTQVKAYLTAHYSGHTRNLAALVPATLVIHNSDGGTVTAPDGTITVNLATAIDKVSLYSTLMHEAKHAVDFKAHVPVEGAAVEGSALSVEEIVVPKFLASVMASDPLLPLYQLVSGLAATRVGATTDATLSIYLRASCATGEPDSLQFAENVVASWGLPSSVLALRSDRAHYGTQYLGYDYGRIAYDLVMTYLQTQLPSGAPTVDPYLLQACAINSPGANAATVATLKTCLGL
ncbi:hypothetical protein BH11MYX1_BH11MYX1_53780 [soil metagenome]